MNIPLFTRAEFNQHMLENIQLLGIIPTTEAYESYRTFVVNKYCPLDPPILPGCRFARVETGTLETGRAQVSSLPGGGTITSSQVISEPAIRVTEMLSA